MSKKLSSVTEKVSDIQFDTSLHKKPRSYEILDVVSLVLDKYFFYITLFQDRNKF